MAWVFLKPIKTATAMPRIEMALLLKKILSGVSMVPSKRANIMSERMSAVVLRITWAMTFGYSRSDVSGGEEWCRSTWLLSLQSSLISVLG